MDENFEFCNHSFETDINVANKENINNTAFYSFYFIILL